MPVRSKATTANYDDTRLDKANAQSFTVQVSNQSVLIQLNVAPFGRGEAWMPPSGIEIRPGYWNFDSDDWSEFGVEKAQGIRVASATTIEGIVSIA